jgi:hypothetical protein
MVEVILSISFDDSIKLNIKCDSANSPLTTKEIVSILPIHGRGIKRGNKIVLPSSKTISVKPEGRINRFNIGDVSINPSNGYITVHLEDTENSSRENKIGEIEGDLNPLNELRMTTNISIEVGK